MRLAVAILCLLSLSAISLTREGRGVVLLRKSAAAQERETVKPSPSLIDIVTNPKFLLESITAREASRSDSSPTEGVKESGGKGEATISVSITAEPTGKTTEAMTAGNSEPSVSPPKVTPETIPSPTEAGPSPTGGETPSPTQETTITPTPTEGASITPSVGGTISVSPSPSASATSSPQASVTATETISPSPTASPTESQNPSPTVMPAAGQVSPSPEPTQSAREAAPPKSVMKQIEETQKDVGDGLSQLNEKIVVPLMSGKNLSVQNYYEQHKMSKEQADSLLSLSLVYVVLGVLLVNPPWLKNLEERSRQISAGWLQNEMYRFIDRML